MIEKKECLKEALTNNKDREFIKEKLNKLYEKGIVLLDPMDEKRIKEIHKIVKEFPNVKSFNIGIEKNKRVVLRHTPNINEFVNVSLIFKEANQDYKNKDYNLCIEKFRLLLKFGHPKAMLYAKLGLAYMKKNDINTAIDYLTIATALSQEEQVDLDFTELIASLKGTLSPEDKKARVKMNLDDFTNDTEIYYGIENINEIIEFIVDGYSLEDTCRKFRLCKEEQDIVTLIIAKEYYIQGNYSRGDMYLKKVEKSKNKTKFVISLMEEIRKNKKFYKNRVSIDHEPLVPSKKIKQ